MAIQTHLALILRALHRVAGTNIGPPYKIHDVFAAEYNRRQLERIVPLVSMTDWTWDKCGIVAADGGPGSYDYRQRLCSDKDNPLYYYQTELLVDAFETAQQDSLQDVYYPAITEREAGMIGSELARAEPVFEMEAWTPDSSVFWKQWIRQEMKANMDDELVNRGKLRHGVDKLRGAWSWAAGDTIYWDTNSDGANTFAQNLVWYEHRHANRRCAAGESFHIAYVSLHQTKTIRSVVLAVGVFIQDGTFYTTMGITKSFRVSMSGTHWAVDEMRKSDGLEPLIGPEEWVKMYNCISKRKGLAVQLQLNIRDRITARAIPMVGLLFRPNGLMRCIMKKNFRNILVGSDVDLFHTLQLMYLKVNTANQAALDFPVRILLQNFPGMIKIKDSSPVNTPFWERLSEFGHPDSALNPHLPLMFISLLEPQNPDVCQQAS